MQESATYRAIVAEGRVEEAKNILRLLGRKRFGPPDEATDAAITAIKNLKRLEELSERLLDVSSWEELLAPLRNRRAGDGRRKAP